MYVLELAFTDDPRRLAARPAHRARLIALEKDGLLRIAGPWADDSGALLVFQTDEPGIREILAGDPYYTTSGVTIVATRAWQPIVGS